MIEQKWWHNSVVYQIYPRSFNDTTGTGVGDLRGIIEKLSYLETLGIDVIWLSPVYESPNDDNGYDISDYQNIMAEFGTMVDMDELIVTAKNHGIQIVMDLVVNHTSDEHPWFIEARKSKENSYHDYYVWAPNNGQIPNEMTSTFSGSAWEYNQPTDEYYLHLFSKKQPDLNFDNPKLRQEIYDMMNYWIDKGIGGFRMDVIDLIGKVPEKMIKENGPKLHDYLQEMHVKTFGAHDLLTVGETWGATPEIAKLYSDPKRNELSMVFQFEHMSVDKIPGKRKWDLAPVNFILLKQILAKWQTELGEQGWNSLFWNNHDLPRVVSRFGNDSEAYRIVSAKMLATILHCQKGTPYIYQGEEIGMTNMPFATMDDYRDIEAINMHQERLALGYSEQEILRSLAAKSRDNARTPMQWDETQYAGFSTVEPWIGVNPNFKTINVEASLNDENSIFNHYRQLIALRKAMPVFTYGEFTLLAEQSETIFAYTRTYQQEKLYVLANFTAETVCYEDVNLSCGEILLSNYTDSKIKTQMNLRPYEALVILIKA